MNTWLNRTFGAVFFLSVIASNANAWSVYRDFNSGSPGSAAQATPDGFDDAASASIYSTEQSLEGGKSAKLQINGGEEGWAKWGGVIKFPQSIKKGESLWMELYMYIPSTFEINTFGNGGLKFIRLRGVQSSGTGLGFVDVQLKDDGSSNSFRMIREYGTPDAWMNFGASNLLTRNSWHRINVYAAVDEKPVASGGNSKVKVWLDGVLLTDESRIQTLINSTDSLQELYLFTYWNGNAPKNQYLYVDKLSMTNVKPTWADSLGAGGAVTAPPAAPVLQVK